MYYAFPPLIGNNAKILILGTFPSIVSREKDEYYGNEKNKFWQIIFDIFDTAYSVDYNKKKQLLFDKGIALWDVVERCEIEGSLDTAIKKPMYNMRLPKFIEDRNIVKVLFNGRNAYKFYCNKIETIEGHILPSTSPANARMGYAEKLTIWRKMIKENL